MKFLCERCKAKYQIADDKVAGKTVRMTCRKCEHPIEVRSAVTETSVASSARSTDVSQPKPVASRAAPPRHAALAAPDEWYESIDGESLGPFRGDELRRRAVSGVLTEDSLVWREGMAEWRRVDSVPALLAMVREAAASRRSTAAPRRTTPAKGVGPTAPNGATPGPARAPRPAPPARSYATPATARLATAEKLDEAPLTLEEAEEKTAPEVLPPAPEVVPDPFASVGAEIAPQTTAAPLASVPSAQPPLTVGRRGPPPFLMISVLLGFASFGAVAGYATYFPPTRPAAPTPPAPTVYVYIPAPATASARTAPETGPITPPPLKGAGHAHVKPVPSGLAAKPIDPGPASPPLPIVPPFAGPTTPNDGPAPAGGSLTSRQIEGVLRSHFVGLRRTCVERNPSHVASSNIVVHLTVNGTGQVTDATATGNDPMTGNCVQKDVLRWQFPPTGGQSVIEMPFHFVQQ